MSQALQSRSPVPLASRAPILRAQGIRKTFRMGDSTVEVLKHVDLALQPGEFVAIEGRSGSGKSTLLHILGALETVDDGAVSFEGRDYTRRDPESEHGVRAFLTGRTMGKLVWLTLVLALAAWAVQMMYAAALPGAVVTTAVFLIQFVLHFGIILIEAVWSLPEEREAARLRNTHFGFVFQFYYLLPELSVLENTLLAPMVEYSWLGYRLRKRELRRRATELLEQLGLGHRLTHRPNQLSGGERQRVAIARALMNRPKVLFADEPTGNLDAETGRQIMGVLEKLHRESGQTIVMVTHDRGLARTADRVLVLKDGRMEKPAA